MASEEWWNLPKDANAAQVQLLQHAEAGQQDRIRSTGDAYAQGQGNLGNFFQSLPGAYMQGARFAQDSRQSEENIKSTQLRNQRDSMTNDDMGKDIRMKDAPLAQPGAALTEEAHAQGNFQAPPPAAAPAPSEQGGATWYNPMSWFGSSEEGQAQPAPAQAPQAPPQAAAGPSRRQLLADEGVKTQQLGNEYQGIANHNAQTEEARRQQKFPVELQQDKATVDATKAGTNATNQNIAMTADAKKQNDLIDTLAGLYDSGVKDPNHPAVQAAIKKSGLPPGRGLGLATKAYQGFAGAINARTAAQRVKVTSDPNYAPYSQKIAQNHKGVEDVKTADKIIEQYKTLTHGFDPKFGGELMTPGATALRNHLADIADTYTDGLGEEIRGMTIRSMPSVMAKVRDVMAGRVQQQWSTDRAAIASMGGDMANANSSEITGLDSEIRQLYTGGKNNKHLINTATGAGAGGGSQKAAVYGNQGAPQPAGTAYGAQPQRGPIDMKTYLNEQGR